MFIETPKEFSIELKEDGDEYVYTLEEGFESENEANVERTEKIIRQAYSKTDAELEELKVESDHVYMKVRVRAKNKQMLMDNTVATLIEQSSLSEMTIVDLIALAVSAYASEKKRGPMPDEY